jgi:hypothetical protein
VIAAMVLLGQALCRTASALDTAAMVPPGT